MMDAMNTRPAERSAIRPPNYGAPALSKGLLILEFLAQSPKGMSQSDLAFATKHSVGEIYRTIQVLLRREYICELPTGEYRLTAKPFEMALRMTPYDSLLSRSLPVLENVRSILGQSVFLSILVDTQHVIIGKVEASGDFGLTIEIGRPSTCLDSTPGTLLHALSRSEVELAKGERSALISKAIRQMWLAEPNPRLEAITDISVPIFRRGNLIAAMTIPYLSSAGAPTARKCLSVVRAWARAISDEISA